jgi:hypothetical protein
MYVYIEAVRSVKIMGKCIVLWRIVDFFGIGNVPSKDLWIECTVNCTKLRTLDRVHYKNILWSGPVGAVKILDGGSVHC